MKIKTIRSNSYFIDNIKINWALPFTNATKRNREIMKLFFQDFWIKTWSKLSNQYYTCLKDNHYNFKVEWHGKFWAKHETRKARDDIKPWFKSFLELDNIIHDHFYMWLDRKLKIGITVARLDLARNHDGNLQNAIPIKSRSQECTMHLAESRKENYITGLSVGKRAAEGSVFFRAYDKRYDAPGIESSLMRFGTIYYVRKEWEIKRRALRNYGITTPEDLVVTIQDKSKINNNDKLTELIFRIRKSADCILEKDSTLYSSIHNELSKNRINPTQNYTMSGHSYEKMSRDYKIFLKKASDKDIMRRYWNPFKQVNPLVEKYGQYLTKEEFEKLISTLITGQSIHQLEVDNYISKVDLVLNTIKNDPNIKTALQDIEKKKKQINHYTQSLLSKNKKNKSEALPH